MRRKTFIQACDFWIIVLYIIVIHSGVALLTDIYPEHDPHVSKHSIMTHMIWIRMLSQILVPTQSDF